ncbi:MAG: insulinase family protein [Culturomica sp.]|jgi:predicted Zn-dependent peptidase|nr:insulinase family protein [Culturomica sp.]
MKTIILSFLYGLSAIALHAQSSLEVKRYQLENGLTVWLNEDHSQPKVYGAVLVKAGAKDAPATGIAHYFEHIMFKGSDRIGTTDYRSEKIYLDSIARKYDELAKTGDELARRGIQQEINRLSIAAAKYAIPNEFNTLISKLGGSGLNASTSKDFTVYYNSFVPQYIDQWLELNSERLIHPVFRLFQSELETVYEEKNMYDDQIFTVAFEKAEEKIYQPHPYQYPVIGLAEHLKNPELSEMERFYQTYYKAGNMALILSGDFSTEEVLPVIREKFSRIQSGEAPVSSEYVLPPFAGREESRIKVPIPVLKYFAMVWRGVPSGHPDVPALKVIERLLSNANGTGLFDRLNTEGKLFEADFFQDDLNDAGTLTLMAIPKLVTQSYRKAEKLVLAEIEKVKRGDFSEQDLEAVKLELRRGFEKNLETIDNKGVMMWLTFAENREWSDYMKSQEIIGQLSKEEIVEAANRYFTDDYLYFRKKTGRYPKDEVDKPGFAPIVPQNKGKQSEYAEQLLKEAGGVTISPRVVDFAKDVQTVELAPLATLYLKENPANTIFSLDINYRKGTDHDPMLAILSSYLEYAGTDTLSAYRFRQKLQEYGATVAFRQNRDYFTISVTGFDQYFDEILSYIGYYLKEVKGDKKALKQAVDDHLFYRKSLKKQSSEKQEALYRYVTQGENSSYKRIPRNREIKKRGVDGLMAIFHELIRTECDIHYTGKLSEEQVSAALKKNLALENNTRKGFAALTYSLKKYEQPVVFFLDDPKTVQSIVYTYTPAPGVMDEEEAQASRFFNTYFGTGMSSLLFQEIREFRSLGYYAYSGYGRTDKLHPDATPYLKCFLSTQADKTIDALTVLDSLLKEMPVKPESVPTAKQALKSAINNAYPSFRNIGTYVAEVRRLGYSEDRNALLLNVLEEMDIHTIQQFYEKNVKAAPTCYIITGNAKRINMELLEQFGEIRKIKLKKVFN